jgi:hypothetical protein
MRGNDPKQNGMFQLCVSRAKSTSLTSTATDQPEFLYKASERVYITDWACEIEFGRTRGLQAAGAGDL